MSAHRYRPAKTRPPRGAFLAFFAVAMQVLVPFFLMIAIARADTPDGVAVICSALGHQTDPNGNTSDHGLADHCSICTSLAAAQAFAPPAVPPLPLPASVGRSDLSAADVAQAALLVTASYQSRGPPSVA
ncbi:MAG TPA: DUF2946 family protein [Stellaceae bacterium]|jgi:hypothetical protein|nr:DUF2946 family protein [Stellaceae bacterium]